MNRFEVLRIFTIFLMLPIALLSIVSAFISIITLNYVAIIATAFFTILFFGLKYNLGGLTMRIHEEYFPKNARIVPIDEWGTTHRDFIPKAKIVKNEF